MPYKINSLIGKPYRPSNGTEGEEFYCQFCYRCKHDDYFRETATSEAHEPGDKNCEIWFQMLDGNQQKEWIHDWQGCPMCTAFEEYDEDDDDGPIDPNQMFLFDLDLYSFGTLGDMLNNWEKHHEYVH